MRILITKYISKILLRIVGSIPIFSSIVLPIVGLLLGEFVLQVARDKGVFIDAGRWWDYMFDTILTHYVMYPLAVVVCLLIGMRLGVNLMHYENKNSSASTARAPSDHLRSEIDRIDTEKRVKAIELIIELDSDLLDPKYDESEATERVDEIFKPLKGLETDNILKIRTLDYCEAVRHVQAAREFLRETSSVSLLWLHPVTGHTVSILEKVSQRLRSVLRGDAVEHNFSSIRPHLKDLNINLVMFENIDFKGLTEIAFKESRSGLDNVETKDEGPSAQS